MPKAPSRNDSAGLHHERGRACGRPQDGSSRMFDPMARQLRTPARPSSLPAKLHSTGLLFLAVAAMGIVSCANAEVSSAEPTRDASTKDLPSDGGADEKGAKNDGATGPDNTPAGVCAPFSNSGCSSDQKCTALLNGSTLSLGCGGKGNKGEGDDCTTTSLNDQPTGDDCGNGLACLFLEGDDTSKCRRLCPTSGTANACPTGSVCTLNLNLPGYLFCGPSCKPLEQTGCAAENKEACYLNRLGAKCQTHPDSPTKIGGSCSTASECEPGSTCITFSSGNKCQAFCSTSGGSPSCPGGTTCQKVPVDDVFMSEPNVGTCG